MAGFKFPLGAALWPDDLLFGLPSLSEIVSQREDVRRRNDAQVIQFVSEGLDTQRDSKVERHLAKASTRLDVLA